MIPTNTLDTFILQEEEKVPGATGELSKLLYSIGLGVKLISRLVATAGFKGLYGYTGKTNVQGEQTHKLDEEADEILVQLLSNSGHFGSLVSEERDGAIDTGQSSENAKYVVAFDPLDGSSNIGTNIPVGTIFAVFKKRELDRAAEESDFLQVGSSLVASGYSVYGAKTSFVYSCGNGVHGFTLDPSLGEFILTEESMRIPEKGSNYSVNEGYWSLWSTQLQEFVSHMKDSQSGAGYSGRYVGSLVADFDRTIRKGGIFLHPGNHKRPHGKLRLLYECIPLAFIAEQAGGFATDGSTQILEKVPESIHERTPFVVGGQSEGELWNKFMGQ